MEFLIVTVIVLLGVLVFETLSRIVFQVKNLETPPPLEPECPPHNWWSIVNEKGDDLGMLCMVCKKTPVDLQRLEE